MKKNWELLAVVLAVIGWSVVGCSLQYTKAVDTTTQPPKDERLVKVSQLICDWTLTVTIIKDTETEREFLVVGDNSNHTVRELTAKSLQDVLVDLEFSKEKK